MQLSHDKDVLSMYYNSAGIPAIPFKEPLPTYSRAYFRFQRSNAINPFAAGKITPLMLGRDYHAPICY
jgi:hypothetical protein